MITKTKSILIGCALITLYVLLATVNLHWGDINQDEGWYLYAGRQVAEGKVPYRDFAFTQGPVLPYFYALANPLVQRFGLAGGRWFTALAGFLTVLLAAALAARGMKKDQKFYAALLAFGLVGINVYQSYFTVVVKTYALCGLLLTGGLWVLSFVRARSVVPGFLAGVLLALAAGTRISAGVALPAVFLYLLAQTRRLGFQGWLSFGAGSAVTLLALFVPIALMAPEGFRFAMIEYHSARSAGGWLPALIYKAGFVSRVVQAYFVLIAAMAGLLLFRSGASEHSQAPDCFPARTGLLWLVGLAITLVHLAAPFPYDDYQVFVVPILGAAVAASWTKRLTIEGTTMGAAGQRWPERVLWLVMLLSAAAAISSPINQSWAVIGQDRIWWKVKKESALHQLQRAANVIRWQAGIEGRILTQDAYLAVETGLSLPPGLEMGPFSYYPDWSAERAQKIHVLNRESMIELIKNTDARVAALSGYSLSIASPAVSELPMDEQNRLWQLVLERFEQVDQISDFGQAHTSLRILRNKAASPSSPP